MRIHCIGIGGIGVSALAQYYLEKDHQVSGSDLVSSELTDFLSRLPGNRGSSTALPSGQKKGIEIFIGNKAEHIKSDLDLVIYSPAVKPDNPEYQEAIRLGVALKSYPEALGELTRQYTTIAVSGSHGKSTTTAMTALVLVAAGLDPTIIVGTKLKEFGNSNFRAGKRKDLVIEACEYDSSFEQYFPKITVVTNVDKEHLDYFKTFTNVIKEFKKFILKLPTDGFLVANKDDPGLKKIINDQFLSINKFTIKQFSIKQPEAKKIAKILKVPGQHNVSNALAALQVARILGVKDFVTFKSLSEFTGTWRRFEVKIAELRGNSRKKTRKITIISDYGHHPNEVSVTLKAAREKYPKKKIWLIFQPHQYQRTYYLFKDFVKVFKEAASAKASAGRRRIDQIIIADIYDVAGREEKNINQKVSSEILVKKIGRKNVQYMPMAEAERLVKENIKSGEVLIIIGAGDIYKLVDKF